MGGNLCILAITIGALSLVSIVLSLTNIARHLG
jgi:hypothetical protein